MKAGERATLLYTPVMKAGEKATLLYTPPMKVEEISVHTAATKAGGKGCITVYTPQRNGRNSCLLYPRNEGGRNDWLHLRSKVGVERAVELH